MDAVKAPMRRMPKLKFSLKTNRTIPIKRQARRKLKPPSRLFFFILILPYLFPMMDAARSPQATKHRLAMAIPFSNNRTERKAPEI